MIIYGTCMRDGTGTCLRESGHDGQCDVMNRYGPAESFPAIGPACERGGEIVDYTIGLCSCGECPTPRPDWAADELTSEAQRNGEYGKGTITVDVLNGPEGRALFEEQRAEIDTLLAFVRDCASNYDCDSGANGAHANRCRKCVAQALLADPSGGVAK